MKSTSEKKRERVGGEVIPLNPRRTVAAIVSEEAEAAVLGAVLRDALVYASISELLQPADFSNLWHGWVWYAFDQIAARGEHIDVVSVCDELEAQHQLYEDSVHRLSGLAGGVPTLAHADTYARIVRDSATRLRVVKAADRMIAAAVDRQTFPDVESFIDECNRVLFQATDQVNKPADTQLAAIVGEYFEQAEAAMNSGTRRGVQTGFANLDDLLRGGVPGELTVIAGAEGMGKTTLLLNMTRNMAKAGLGVAVFTLEMSREEIARILISMESGLPKRALKAFDFSQEQWTKFVAGVGGFGVWNVEVIDEFPSLTPIQLRRRLRTLTVAQHRQMDAVIVDGLWLMEDTYQAVERHEAVRNITRDLIQVGRDFGVPIYITHQYNGDAYKRNDKRPLLHDLAESAGVRRNAQVILGLYRDSYYGIKRYGTQDISELHVLKDRNGSGAQGNHADFYFDLTHNLFLPKFEGQAP